MYILRVRKPDRTQPDSLSLIHCVWGLSRKDSKTERDSMSGGLSHLDRPGAGCWLELQLEQNTHARLASV